MISQYNRFDDWKILCNIESNRTICYIHSNKIHCLLKSIIKRCNSNDGIYSENQLASIQKKYYYIVLDDIKLLYKLIKCKQRGFNIDDILHLDGKIIIFKKNNIISNTYKLIIRLITQQIKVDSIYSILPFLNENPMFFLSVKNNYSIKHSLDIIVNTSQTISPEARALLGLKYTLGLSILKCIKALNMFWVMKYLSFGYLVEINTRTKFEKYN